MKIKEVIFENFKPYYGKVRFDLTVTDNRNIVLIGGRNGQGKTSFLVGVVWCLYGKRIKEVDAVFRQEVKIYANFLERSLNWIARDEGKTSFSIEVIFDDVELSEFFTKSEQKTVQIGIKRTYNSESRDDSLLEIFMDGKEYSLLSEESEKINFIEDYIIPIETAKFIFFDAEKIADIAALKSNEQASVMNDALGKILGLSVYENLRKDIEDYANDLQRAEAPETLKQEIASWQHNSDFSSSEKQKKEEEIELNEEKIDDLDSEIGKLTNEIMRRGTDYATIDIETLKDKELKLNAQLEEIKGKFREVENVIPFCISAHKLAEVVEQVDKEIAQRNARIQKAGLLNETRDFAKKLFHLPPYPKEDDIEPEQKNFYYEKAKTLILDLLSKDLEDVTLSFEHDLDKSDIKNLKDVSISIQQYSKDTFDAIFSEYMRVKNEYEEAVQDRRRAEASAKDEIVQEYKEQRRERQRERDKLIDKTGALRENVRKLSVEIIRSENQIKRLLEKVELSNKYKEQLKLIGKYIRVLDEFVQSQKEQKKNKIAENLTIELGRLLNKKNLVNSVEINILLGKKNKGMEVRLYNDKRVETEPSTDMSKGEQQLYISALLKAILAEAIQDLPILIDTPLGRLDQEHRDNILQYYYPRLSEQVIIFSTNTEIRSSDLFKIDRFVSKCYRLENQLNKTTVQEGYF